MDKEKEINDNHSQNLLTKIVELEEVFIIYTDNLYYYISKELNRKEGQIEEIKLIKEKALEDFKIGLDALKKANEKIKIEEEKNIFLNKEIKFLHKSISEKSFEKSQKTLVDVNKLKIII